MGTGRGFGLIRGIVALVALAGCEPRQPAEVAIANVVRNNDAGELERYLGLGGDANQKSRDGYPLIYLAAGPRGGLETMLVLLNAGVDPNSLAENGRSPLMNAAGWCDRDMVRLLLRAGADPAYRAPDGKSVEDSVCAGPLDLRADVLNILAAAR